MKLSSEERAKVMSELLFERVANLFQFAIRPVRNSTVKCYICERTFEDGEKCISETNQNPVKKWVLHFYCKEHFCEVKDAAIKEREQLIQRLQKDINILKGQ